MSERIQNLIEFPSASQRLKVAREPMVAQPGPPKKRGVPKASAAKHPSRRATDFPSNSTSIAARNRPGDAVILLRTGKSWRDWFVLLNAAGADRSARKKAIAAHTTAKPSWRDLVLIAYEMDTAKRAQYCQPGGYEITVSATVSIPVAQVSAYWTDEHLRERWLGKQKLVVGESTGNKSMEIVWNDGESCLLVELEALDAGRSRVNVNHRMLPQRKVSDMRLFWDGALKALSGHANAAKKDSAAQIIRSQARKPLLVSFEQVEQPSAPQPRNR